MHNKRIILFISLGIIIPIFCIVYINMFSVLGKYRGVSNDYKSLSSKLMEPINDDNGTFNSKELKDILSNIPDSKISLITEIGSSDGSVNIIRKLGLSEFETLGDTIIEVCIESNNMESLLKYLSDKKLGYEYINLKQSVLSIRILVKGEE